MTWTDLGNVLVLAAMLTAGVLILGAQL